jgi:UDP-N-acetylglucosamine acyltransferase
MATIINDAGQVIVEAGAHVERTAVLIGPCVIKAGAYVGHHAVIGSPPQHRGHYPSPLNGKREYAGVELAEEAVVREHCQVQQGIKRTTWVGYEALVMAMTHVSHDSIVGSKSTIATNSVLGGYTTIMDGVTFGQCVVTHPWNVIGSDAMIGQGSVVIKDVMPLQKMVGNPARLIGANTGPGGEKMDWSEDMVSPDNLREYNYLCNFRDDLRRS